MISEKMTDVAENIGHAEEQRGGALRSYPDNVAQAIIDAAWHRFDAEDPDTWPNGIYAPSGHFWLVTNAILTSAAAWEGDAFKTWRPRYGIDEFSMIEAYVDPVDLLPSFVNCSPKHSGEE